MLIKKKSRLIYINLVWVPFLVSVIVFAYFYFAGSENVAAFTGMAFCIGAVIAIIFSGDACEQKFTILSKAELKELKTQLRKDRLSKIIVFKFFKEVTVHYL